MAFITAYRHIKHVLRLKPNLRAYSTSNNLVEKWSSKFKEENISEVESSLVNILAHVLKTKTLNKIDLKTAANSLSEQQISYFEQLCECRMARMPVQYIIKEWDFRELTLQMYPPVLIPRPETEELVELIINRLNPDNSYRIMEVGCGSGAISVSILNTFPKIKCLAIDQSKLACELTVSNAKKYDCSNRLKVIRHKLTTRSPMQTFGEQFDLIVSNPPYLSRKELIDLEPEIKLYEDMRALDGGNDGLDVIKAILMLASKMLKLNSDLWLEVNVNHPKLIDEYLSKSEIDLKLKVVDVFQDINRKDRFIRVVKC